MLRVLSQLPDEVENLIYRTIGCGIKVHRALGPGLLESIYARAMCLELDAVEIPYQREKHDPVTYRGQLLCDQRVDVVVDGQLILEIEAVEHLIPVHKAQLICYLRLAKLHVGLLMNFNVPILQDGVKRVVL